MPTPNGRDDTAPAQKKRQFNPTSKFANCYTRKTTEKTFHRGTTADTDTTNQTRILQLPSSTPLSSRTPSSPTHHQHVCNIHSRFNEAVETAKADIATTAITINSETTIRTQKTPTILAKLRQLQKQPTNHCNRGTTANRHHQPTPPPTAAFTKYCHQRHDRGDWPHQKERHHHQHHHQPMPKDCCDCCNCNCLQRHHHTFETTETCTNR